jgi:PIN domain nuclease of toxin-antitoxin system
LRLLLDTHVFLWWASTRGARLSDRVRGLLVDGDNDVALSIASAWEMAIKVGSGRLSLPERVEDYIPARLRKDGFDFMPIEFAHACRAGALPRIHSDPFDRMLVAQAQVEGIPILSADPVISRYDVETIW